MRRWSSCWIISPLPDAFSHCHAGRPTIVAFPPSRPGSRDRADGQPICDFLHRKLPFFSIRQWDWILPPDEVAALETRTEGWIAGLQLAALSLQGRTDKARLIESFTGSNRLVLDYLIEEVLEPAVCRAIQQFLYCKRPFSIDSRALCATPLLVRRTVRRTLLAS